MPVGQHIKKFIESQGGGYDALGKAKKFICAALKKGDIKWNQIHLKELAESFGFTGARMDLLEGKRRNFLEADDAVDASHFAAITGQLLIQRVRDKWKLALSIAEQLCTIEPITNGNLGPQREPWLSDVAERPDKLQPGMEYPASRFEPEFVDYPAPEKYGRLSLVTMEMVFSDLTRQAWQSADSVGTKVALWFKKRILKVVLGMVNNHSWNGTTYNTYQTSAPWINAITGLQIRNWDDLNTLELLFANMLDPVLNEVIEIDPANMSIFCMPSNKYNLRRIVTATNTRKGPFATSGVDNDQTDAPNPLDTTYPILTDKHAYKLLTDPTTARDGGLGVSAANAKEYVFLGDFKRAFRYRQVYPLRTVEAPPLNPLDFKQDIAVAVKAGEFGVAGVADPRYVVWSKNS